MRFFATFLRTIATLAVLYAVIGAIVNPRRELLGDIFPALQPNSRATKLSMLEAHARERPITALILGSSRSMQLGPAALGGLTGQPFFNLAVFSGRAEDFLALYRAASWRLPVIQTIVVGVDPEGFDPREPREQELENNAALMQKLRGKPYHVTDWCRFVGRRLAGLFTIGYVRDVAASVLASRHPPIPMYAFRADGLVEYPKFDREIAAGTFSLDPVLANCTRQAVVQLERLERTDTTRLAYVRTLLSEARARGTEVVLWAPPMHPQYALAVAANRGARANLDRVLNELRAIASETSVPFVDLSRPDSYGSDPSQWYDCIHYRSSEAKRIAAKLAAAMSVSATHGF